MDLDQHSGGASADPRAAAEIFYDGGCPVCRREIRWYQGLRGGSDMRWTDVTDPATVARFPDGFDQARLLKRFTVRRADGAVMVGAGGFVSIWRGLNAFRWLGRAMDNRVGVWIGDRAYWAFLRLRRLWRRPARHAKG